MLFLDLPTGGPGRGQSGESGHPLPDVLPKELPPARAHVASLCVQVPQLSLPGARAGSGGDSAGPSGGR